MTPFRTLMALAMIACAAPALAQGASTPPAFDRAAWKQDFERIKRGLAEGYANLDWQVEKRGLNLARADQQINAMLDKANSDVEAVVVFYRLVDAFHDPHLQLLPGAPPDSARLLPRQSDADAPIVAADSCGGYSDGKAATPLPYAKAPEWREVSAGPFQTGTLGDIGIIRIPSFDEQRYLSVCKTVAKPGLDGEDLRHATRAELNKRLTALIAELRGKGITKLAVDISGNGGGSEWSSEVAAMLASGTLKRTAPRLAGAKCDRTPLWQGKPVCSIYAADAEIEELQGTGVWTGPLALLVDRRTASASEELVTWLKDNRRAAIAGERTYGAGCGYVDGGSAIALKAAPLHIMVPNCSRYTSEGINEIEGISPTVSVDWVILKPEQTAAELERLF
jgi:hypothetical protein